VWDLLHLYHRRELALFGVHHYDLVNVSST
jgi:hypothetical protein